MQRPDGSPRDVVLYSEGAHELAVLQPIADELARRGAAVRITDDLATRGEVGLFACHANRMFDFESGRWHAAPNDLSVLALHDLGQDGGQGPRYFSTEPWHAFDLGVLPGPSWMASWEFAKAGGAPRPFRDMHLGGWPKADHVYRDPSGFAAQVAALRSDLGLGADDAVVLLACSWSDRRQLEDLLTAIGDDDARIVVKYPGLTRPDESHPWHRPITLADERLADAIEAAEVHPDVIVAPTDTDIMALVALADVVVSNGSNVLFEGVLAGTGGVSVRDWTHPAGPDGELLLPPTIDLPGVVTGSVAALRAMIDTVRDPRWSDVLSASAEALVSSETLGRSAALIADLIEEELAREVTARPSLENAAANAEIQPLHDHIVELEGQAARAREQLARQGREVEDARAAVARTHAQLQQYETEIENIRALASHANSRRADTEAALAEAERGRGEAEERASNIARDSAWMRHELAGISESISWRALMRARTWWRGPGPRPRVRARVGSHVLRFVRDVAGNQPATPVIAKRRAKTSPEPNAHWVDRGAAIRLPRFPHPEASIVIPTYANAELLARCLTAIGNDTSQAAFEVVVVDDGQDPATKALLRAVDGITLLENEENLGYLRSVNRGAAAARGATLVLLNDDTEPHHGWLDHLLARLLRPGVGAVGGKLIYPDGRLQEAGGIIWGDGSAWNYGNGADPGDRAFCFARPVDFCSAACLAIGTELWMEIGGFDMAYAPGYYEDVDLAFAVRRAGREVWYEPTAVVTHHEGASHGTDLESGVKRHQVINARTFATRWSADFEHGHHRADVAVAHDAADRRDGPIVIVVDHQIPEPDRDAGSSRMEIIVQLLGDLGCRVVFIPDSGAVPPDYAARLEAHGTEVLTVGADFPAQLTRRAGACDLVVLSRPTVAARFLPTIREFLPDTRVAFDTVDLHHLRERDRALVSDLSPGIADAYEALELAMATATETTLVVTDDERDHLARRLPELDVRVVPLGNDPRPDATPGRAGRAGFIFVGGFRHLPNIDAALRLGGPIAKAMRREGLRERITLVGPDAPPAVQQLAGPDVRVTGWVPAVEPLLDRHVALVAPLSYGAGMKGKVTQALAQGVPVITTRIGAQGLGLVHERDALIAETDAEFAAAMVRLEQDPALWTALSDRGPEVVRERCSRDVIRRELVRLLDEHR